MLGVGVEQNTIQILLCSTSCHQGLTTGHPSPQAGREPNPSLFDGKGLMEDFYVIITEIIWYWPIIESKQPKHPAPALRSLIGVTCGKIVGVCLVCLQPSPFIGIRWTTTLAVLLPCQPTSKSLLLIIRKRHSAHRAAQSKFRGWV